MEFLMTCYSIGYFREDGDFAILATVIDNDESLQVMTAQQLAANIAASIQKELGNEFVVVILERQDSPDYVDVDADDDVQVTTNPPATVQEQLYARALRLDSALEELKTLPHADDSTLGIEEGCLIAWKTILDSKYTLQVELLNEVERYLDMTEAVISSYSDEPLVDDYIDA
jgi:hypothetical protein